MRKIEKSYFYKFWRRYGLMRQFVLLGFCIVIWIGLACSVTRAESGGYGGRHMSLNNQMINLTEMLQLTSDQQSRVRTVLEEYQNKRRDLIWNRTCSREETRDKMMALRSEQASGLISFSRIQLLSRSASFLAGKRSRLPCRF